MWNYLTGKKTWIGGALVAIGAATEYAGITGVGSIIATIGGALGIVGVGHKAQRIIVAIQSIVDVVNELISEK